MTATRSQTSTSNQRRSRRLEPRTAALGLAVLLFIGAVLWLTDTLSRIGAQSLLARAVQRQVSTQNRPQVHLHGTFFLPQVVEGKYDDVDITVAPLQFKTLRIESFHADLRGVHLPFHDVLTQHLHHIVADHTTERATLSFTDIDHYLASMNVPLQVSAAAHHRVQVTGSVPVLGLHISASADAKVTAAGSTLYITPTQFHTGLSGLDNAGQLLLGQRFTIQIPLGTLPFGQSLHGVTVRQHGVTVRASGSEVVLYPPPRNGP